MVDIDVGILDKLNPFKGAIDGAINIVDQAVVDKDLRAQLRAQLTAIELENNRLLLNHQASIEQMREASYQKELETVTTPKVDALHKMARIILSFASMIITPGAVIWLSYIDVEINMNIVTAIMTGNAGTAIYNYKKGRGYVVGADPNIVVEKDLD